MINEIIHTVKMQFIGRGF